MAPGPGTGLDVELIELFHVYSDPARDKRMHTLSTVFIGRAHGTPKAGDDAARAVIAKPDALPASLVFDHARSARSECRSLSSVAARTGSRSRQSRGVAT